MEDKWQKEAQEIGARMVKIRGRMTQEEFGNALGIHKNTLRNYEKGERMPDALMIKHICEQYGILPDWFLFGTEPMYKREKEELEKLTVKFGTTEEMGDEYVLVPRYENPDVELSYQGKIIDPLVNQIAFRKSWVLGTMGLYPDKLAFILIYGDAMDPTLRHGDILLLDLSQNKAINDDIYALNFDGNLVVKRLQLLPDGGIIIRSDNPAYEGHRLDKQEKDKLKIIARVVWLGRKI